MLQPRRFKHTGSISLSNTRHLLCYKPSPNCILSQCFNTTFSSKMSKSLTNGGASVEKVTVQKLLAFKCLLLLIRWEIKRWKDESGKSRAVFFFLVPHQITISSTCWIENAHQKVQSIISLWERRKILFSSCLASQIPTKMLSIQLSHILQANSFY